MNPETGRAWTSFRDPAGHLLSDPARGEGAIQRWVHPNHTPVVRALLESAAASQLMDEGKLVRTRAVEGDERTEGGPGEGLLLEHDRIPFVSYPEEWCPGTLHAAAELTIELCQRGMGEGYLLKDATPRNVLFRGTRPVFVDFPSLEPRDEGNPTWTAHGQFLQTFLLPLLLSKELGLPVSALTSGYPDGVSPSQAVRALPLWKRLRPGTLSLATLPALLARSGQRMRGGKGRMPRFSEEVSAGVLRRHFRSLRRQLQRLAPASGRSGSVWAGYQKDCHYTREAWDRKVELVEQVVRERTPRTVLDLGCNEGAFSRIAALRGASVVAVDADEGVVQTTWEGAREEALDIHPLVVNLATPTPALGWRNRERASFLSRMGGRFEGVFALALVHHLLVTYRLPLDEILALIRDFATEWAVVEFVPNDDPLFRSLAWGREHLFVDHDEARFFAALGRLGTVEMRERLPGTGRVLAVVSFG